MSSSFLANSARPHPQDAQLVGVTDPTQKIVFTLFVRPKASAPSLPDLEYWQKTPLNEREFLSSEDFANTYGSSAEDVAVVQTALESSGMTVKNQHLGAGAITVEASPAQIQSLFEVKLNNYKAATPVARLKVRRGADKSTLLRETEIYHGYEGQISLPTQLQGIVTQISGLDNRDIAAHGGFSGDPVNSVQLPVRTIAGLYQFPSGIDSSDQTIGVFSGGGWDTTTKQTQSNYQVSDITTYFSNQPTGSGFTTPPKLVPIPLTVGSNGPYNNDPTNPTAEITQDIETSSTIAQGCTVNVYFSDITEQGWIVFLNRVLFPQGTEQMPNVISISWIMFDENTYGNAFSFLFQRLATVGITVFAISGDWGSNDSVSGAERVGYPAADPWVTCVGGTVVGNVQPGTPQTFDEYAWSDIGNTSTQFNFTVNGVNGGTTGGGMSTLFSTPAYQTAAGITSFKDSKSTTHTGGRFIPDIAGMVGYNGFWIGGFNSNFIGTSCSAPLYAGLFASLRSALGKSLGVLNPTLYQLGSANATNGVFKDTTIGNNDPGATPDDPYYLAGPGYDPCTGWGSINGTQMLNSLAKILYPPNLYVTTVKNSFGLPEAQGHAIGGTSTWTATIFLTLDGFAPNDLSVAPTVPNPMGSDTSVTIGPAQFELKNNLTTVQRILFPVTISFGPLSTKANNATPPGIFPAPGGSELEFTLTFSLQVASGQTLSAIAPIYLLPGADPYFSPLAPNVVGEEWYLNQDLRVFTVCPGINNSPIVDNSRSGRPVLQPNSLTDWEATPGYLYITGLLNYLNSPGTADPFSLLPDQSSALTEDSTVAPAQINPTGNGPNNKYANYVFAVARVRCSGPSDGKPVKVFFRLFTSNSPSTWFLPGSSYLSSPPAPSLPESPLVASDGTSIPFFASGNLQTNTDYATNGVNNKTITSTGNSYTYFGCFLDIYSGNYTLPKNGKATPVSAFLPGGHQCIVAQIAFDDAPILTLNGVTPSPQNCPQLAQRNLQVSLSDNPGPLDTHLIPQTFDVAPTAIPPANPGQFVDLPDELMIDWGNTPIGSTAQIYWPSLTVSSVISLAKNLYPTHQLRTVAGDPNTIEVTVPEGFTFVPIPFGSGPNIAGLFTIQLPLGIVQGQEFLITVRRISSRIYEVEDVPSIVKKVIPGDTPQSSILKPPTRIEAVNYRYTAGIFAVKIPVVVGREMLPIELDAQSIIAWRLNQLSPTDRWYKVMQRYLSYINGRVSGLGGLGPVVPSPTGIPPGKEGPKPCPPPCDNHDKHHHHDEDCGDNHRTRGTLGLWGCGCCIS